MAEDYQEDSTALDFEHYIVSEVRPLSSMPRMPDDEAMQTADGEGLVWELQGNNVMVVRPKEL